MPGLAVIGVHTPEFAFEKDLDNVRRAMQHMNIGFPIALDNDYAIWRAFDNHYWPALYLLDAGGRVRYRHFGEGEYERSEKAIQRLLGPPAATGDDRGVVSVTATGFELPADWQNLKSPEIYLGHDRSESFASPGGASLAKRRAYKVPARLDLNRWALDGEWTMEQPADGPGQRPWPDRLPISRPRRPPGHGAARVAMAGCASASRSTVSRQVLRAAWTSMTAAPAPSSSSGCTN